MPTRPTREWRQMPFFMVAASHSPLLDFPARESSSVLNILAALAQARARIRAFDPELVILFGVDHYGGHHLDSMPSFCVGGEATALVHIGGTPRRLTVPRELAVQAVQPSVSPALDTARP